MFGTIHFRELSNIDLNKWKTLRPMTNLDCNDDGFTNIKLIKVDDNIINIIIPNHKILTKLMINNSKDNNKKLSVI